MRQILKDFLDNNEANDAYVTNKVTYISIEDVETLLDRQAKQLTIPVVGSQRELLCVVCGDNEVKEPFDCCCSERCYDSL